MNDIAFDDGIAGAVIRAAERAADELRAQGSARRTAAEDAHTDYSGAYADRFIEAIFSGAPGGLASR
ncbi:hypothetical protein DEJ23_09980 [Curtobacterium sp. MCSS17_008]|uniref:hypothetical protein n=1 Tax=Curtobacterium sp. MCSS17_008 TaxID=2175647 RepID=UPI000DA7DE33|nr:hypothetical protein [Curtobacterium sp. MCSS17_008]PZF56488.1 hypothetical protein DEJ23_09980 [Curtobacterium sp. MCSS17_008]